MLKAGVINVTGYAGSELARLLHAHPEVELVAVTGRSAAGKRLPEALPYLWQIDLPITRDIEVSVDVVFSALPTAASAEALAPFIESGVRAVDIAADFRLKDVKEFEEVYGKEHPAPHLVQQAVYGLTEVNREAVRGARLVANPGCYPTSALLALVPAVREGLISEGIVVDAKSGISGAGRGGLGASVIDHFCEADENVVPYRLEGHGHLPEIVQELAAQREGFRPRVTFVPHRVPMVRGILSTCYADLTDTSLTGEEVRQIYREFYEGEPFVKVPATVPQTKETTGTNLCLVYPTVDRRTGRLIVVSAIDNLVKGAAGQAVQNMNVMCGFPETAGLQTVPLYP
jgi:N-acetyl-gamma-glutamyl-phosphate reductase